MVYNNKTIIDTNIWIAYFNESDHDHKKSLVYKEICFSEQTMPDLVFYETLTILKNKVKDAILLNRFNTFATQNLDITIQLFYEHNAEILNMFINDNKDGLSYTDTLLLYLSKEYSILTFDTKLQKRIKEYGGKLIC